MLPTELTAPQIRFLRAFEACSSITKAARWAKIQRKTHYIWLRESPRYVEEFEKAEKVAADVLQDEAVRRAHEGLRKVVRYKGKIVGYETEYSDQLLITMLKASNPKKFRDNSSVEVTGKDGKPLLDLESVRAYCQSVKGKDE